MSVKRVLGSLLELPISHWSKRALETRGYLDFLSKRPPEALAPVPADLWSLYKLVRSRKPKMMFEFGSGCSTVILAQALYDNAQDSENQRGFLYSLDVNEKWLEVTRSTMPARLEGFYEIVHAPVVTVDHKGTTVFRHQNVPQVPLDMIYLDGPPMTTEVSVAIDPIDLEGFFRPRFVMCVDGRRRTAKECQLFKAPFGKALQSPHQSGS